MRMLKLSGFNSCLDKMERCLKEVFKILHVQQSVFCRCRVKTDRKKPHYNLLCCVLLDDYNVAKYSIKFCKRSAVSGHDFQILRVRQYRISSILSQSVRNIRFIECYLVPDHQEVVKYM